MQRPPRDPCQSVFAGGLGWFIGWVGLLIGGLTLGTRAWGIRDGDAHWQTMTFTVLCFTQLGSALAIRSSRESLFTLGLFSNKPMLSAVALSVALQLLIVYLPFSIRFSLPVRYPGAIWGWRWPFRASYSGPWSCKSSWPGGASGLLYRHQKA